MTLKEVDPSKLAQHAPGLRMRWFSSSGNDLFVWLTPEGRLAAFQYTRGHEILAWSPEDGLRTGLLDDGEVGRPSVQKMSPLVRYDASADGDRRARLFASLQSELISVEPELASSVLASLR